jgi:hypothetical protein
MPVHLLRSYEYENECKNENRNIRLPGAMKLSRPLQIQDQNKGNSNCKEPLSLCGTGSTNLLIVLTHAAGP